MFEFSAEYNLIKDGDVYIKLSPKETKILAVLLANIGLTCDFASFDVTTEREKSSLRTCVNRLNKKLKNYIRISSIAGEGYFMVYVPTTEK